MGSRRHASGNAEGDRGGLHDPRGPLPDHLGTEARKDEKEDYRKQVQREASEAGDRGEARPDQEPDLTHVEDRSDWERLAALTDEDIERTIADDPDAAPVLDEAFWRNAEILDPRHEKSTITMRVDDDVLDFFKRGGPGYQSRMNAVLRAYVYARRAAR